SLPFEKSRPAQTSTEPLALRCHRITIFFQNPRIQSAVIPAVFLPHADHIPRRNPPAAYLNLLSAACAHCSPFSSKHIPPPLRLLPHKPLLPNRPYVPHPAENR